MIHDRAKVFDTFFWNMAKFTAIPDMVRNLAKLVVSVCRYTGWALPYWVDVGVGYALWMTWFGATSHTFVMTLNRFFAVALPLRSITVFSSSRAWKVAVGLHIFSVLTIAFGSIEGIRYVGTKGSPDITGTYFLIFDSLYNATIGFGMSILYIAIIVKVTMLRKQTAMKNEVILALQSLLIALPILLTSVFYGLYSVQLMPVSVMRVILSPLSMLVTCINPLVYLLLCRDVRNDFLALLKGVTAKVAPQPTY